MINTWIYMMIYTYGLYVKTYLQLDRKVVYIFMKMGRNRVFCYGATRWFISFITKFDRGLIVTREDIRMVDMIQITIPFQT